MDYIEEKNHKTLIRLFIQPGANKNEVVGLYGEPARIKIKIKAQPVENAANIEVISFIAKLLSLPKSSVEMLRGETSRQKDLLVDLESTEVKKIFTSVLKI